MKRGFATILVLGLVVAVFALITAFYLRQKSTITEKITTQSSPTPQSSQADETTNWKTISSTTYFSLKYPSFWSLVHELPKVEGSEGNYFYEIRDNKDSPNNTLRIITRNYPELKTTSVSPEKLIEQIKNDELNANKGFKNFGQEVINEENTIIGGKNAIRYEINLKNPQHLKFNKLTWIYIFSGFDRITIMSFEGNDEETFDQILSTFKFLDQK